MRCTSRIYVDVLVVGSGLAGLTAAISAAERGC
ncbi:MAG: FAD-binding protein [Enterocloster clostridioformis]